MRRDIQLLRGIAVLLVVIYHARLNVFTHGYLGVDVFFVISGFLITKIILEGLGSNNFSFFIFYLRRAKRLLPALYSTLLLTALVSAQVLTPEQKIDFVQQFIGAITFSANMVLPTQINYFADDAANMPLLHIWSLSLEEQYYFALPLFLFLVPSTWRLKALILAFSLSLLWCFKWAAGDGDPPFLWRFGEASISEWAFFLFPTRAWELLAGSICAWLLLHGKTINVAPIFKWAALLTIIVVSFFGFDTVHPRGDAFVVVIATALLLLGNDRWLPQSKIVNGVERVGDWSYSVYLVHWPLFAFAYIAYAEQVPVLVDTLLIPLSIAVGFLQYKYIESPFRYSWNHPSGYVWKRVVAATFVLAITPLTVFGKAAYDVPSNDRFADVRKVNYGLSDSCEGSFEGNELKAACVHGVNPDVAVWGDSFAMHLVPGLIRSNPNLVQLTKSVCGPFRGLAPISEKYNKSWAQGCAAENEKSFSYITSTNSIKYVILSSPFGQYFNDLPGQYYIDGRVVSKDTAVGEKYLIETINKLKEAGKVPILVSPPPRSGFNIGACLERQDRDLVNFRRDCLVDYNEYIKESLNNVPILSDQTSISINQALKFQDEAGFA